MKGGSEDGWCVKGEGRRGGGEVASFNLCFTLCVACGFVVEEWNESTQDSAEWR